MPLLLAADEITFSRPVEIGSMVLFDSHVTYVGGSDGQGASTLAGVDAGVLGSVCHVRAETQVVDLAKGLGGCFTSNTFEFTFLCSSKEVARS